MPFMVHAHCVCKLASAFTRPFTWEVEVWATTVPYIGQRRVYQVPGDDEQRAAQLGMEIFSREMIAKERH